MNVRELIERLQKCDPDLPVWMSGSPDIDEYRQVGEVIPTYRLVRIGRPVRDQAFMAVMLFPEVAGQAEEPR